MKIAQLKWRRLYTGKIETAELPFIEDDLIMLQISNAKWQVLLNNEEITTKGSESEAKAEAQKWFEDCIMEFMDKEATKLFPVKRIEVIDEKGRSYVNWNEANKVELRIQDDEQTLKIFISRDI
jgi:hypothetical protein